MSNSSTPRYVFNEGDFALFLDRRGRRYLAQLAQAGSLQTHLGRLDHSGVIGKEEGSWFTSNNGHLLLALKPTLADFTLDMPRIATVVYPKDLGTILIQADIFPGAKVLEAGTGSGALTMTLLRAVGPQGCVVSYDVRDDMIERAKTNVNTMLPDSSNITFKSGDVYLGFDENGLDRIVLDLPEPWHVVPYASERLVPGGIILCFLPTILQVHELVQRLRDEKTFELIETNEIMMRPWNVSARSVRPEHRMVAHTGFIITARKCSPRPVASDESG